MVFTNKSCNATYSVCMNGLNLSRVFVTKFLGVHIDSKLDWNDHINIVRNKIAKNISVMNRVKHVLTSSALCVCVCIIYSYNNEGTIGYKNSNTNIIKNKNGLTD